MERKILVEVNKQELEALEKGFTLKSISTNDLIGEIILRCDDKKTYNGICTPLGVATELITLEGKIEVENKLFRFTYTGAKKYDNY